MFVKKRNIEKYGKWAVVTGATDGIGKAMAIKLACKGLSIVLISRSEDKLKDTAEEINMTLKKQNKKAVEVKTIAVDFSLNADKVYPIIKEKCEGLDVGILVNNVGISYAHAQYYSELDESFISQLIEINVRSVLSTTKLFLSKMIEKKKGMIVNVASGAATLPSDPLYSAYAATKAVAVKFTESLQAECNDFNIVIQCHAPLLVTSKLSKIKKESFFCPTPNTYAKCAINAMECNSIKTPVCCPFIPHQIQSLVAKSLPISLWNWMRLGQTKAIRSKAMKKSKQEKME